MEVLLTDELLEYLGNTYVEEDVSTKYEMTFEKYVDLMIWCYGKKWF
ncbi:hypothetical protein NST17_20340 [Caldifermentibacillus hisashii]|uniref:Uncharacterized protein n=1 Tax=Caldifermentibacillus hisashii TaxID=996558 RepID=A0ABU9K389_9BACI